MKITKIRNKMGQDEPRWPQAGPQEPPVGPKVAPRSPQEGPKGLQDNPKRAQDEAKMAQHGASDSELKPKGRNIIDLKQTHKAKQCFLRVQGLRIGPT